MARALTLASATSSSLAAPATAPVPATPTNPTAPASTSSFLMQGLGCLIVPASPSGKMHVALYATATDTATTVGTGIALKLYCGTGTVPVNTGAIPGAATQIGTTVEWATGVTMTTAADSFAPIAMSGVITGVTAGVQYWCDVAAESVITNSVVALTNVTVEIHDL